MVVSCGTQVYTNQKGAEGFAPRRSTRSMRKLKLSLILPAAQVVIANILLGWKGEYSPFMGDTRAFCFAINSPIMVLLAPIYSRAPIHWLPRRLFGIRGDNFLILVAVALVWFLVGLALDQLGWQKVFAAGNSHKPRVLLKLGIATCGIWLFFRAGLGWISSVDSEHHHWIWYIVYGTIAIGWSIVLITPLVRTILSWISNPPLPE